MYNCLSIIWIYQYPIIQLSKYTKPQLFSYCRITFQEATDIILSGYQNTRFSEYSIIPKETPLNRRRIVERSTITGNYTPFRLCNVGENCQLPRMDRPEWGRLPSRGRHQGEQSTVLLKNVVPVEGTASCVFVKRKPYGLTAKAIKPSVIKFRRSLFK